MATEEEKTIPERRIEIRIFRMDGEMAFEARGNVTRRTSHRFLESVGYAFIPEEPNRYPMPVLSSPVGKISCENSRDCTDYPSKCSECEANKAKSYFKPKNK